MSAKRTFSALLSLWMLAMSAIPAAAKKGDDEAEWTPLMWGQEDTLQFRTDCPDEGEHWSYVWLVVLDGDVYVRLGSKAAGRIDCNKTKPIVGIRIEDKLEFPAVEMVPAPDKAEAVAQAMAAKYWTDVFIRYFDHPYTMKLVPRKEGEVIGAKATDGDDAAKAGESGAPAASSGDAKKGDEKK